MSDETDDRGRALLQLAATLRLAAQRLADSAGRMQTAAHRQRDQLERLGALRDRIVELLAACRRLTGAQHPDLPAPAAAHAEADGIALPTAPEPTPRQGDAPSHRLPPGAFIELSSWQEFDKFRHMEPITAEEVAACDTDELIRRLSEAQA